jgi:hypothetical protein
MELSEQIIDALFKPKKAKLRDLVGIFAFGLGTALMTPEWRLYMRMSVADSVIRSTAAKAKAKANGKPATKPEERPTMGAYGHMQFPSPGEPYGYKRGMD